jgi:hypothetical protein
MSRSADEDVELGAVSAAGSTSADQAPQALRADVLQNSTINGQTTPVVEAPSTRRTNSGTWWQRHFKRSRDTSSDELEVYLQGTEQSERRDNILQDYAKLKDRLVGEELIPGLLSFTSFQPGSQSEPRVLLPDEGITVDHMIAFGAHLGVIRSELTKGKALEGSWALRSWQVTKDHLLQSNSDNVESSILSCQTPISIRSKFFGFKSKLFISNRRLQRMVDTPWLAILYTIAEQWALPNPVLELCLKITRELQQKLVPFHKLDLSSKFYPNNCQASS